MDISSSDIAKLNLRNIYIDNQLYLSKRKTNCYFQEGLRLAKLYDASQTSLHASWYIPPAIIALKKAICVDKYNEDAKYVLKYIMAHLHLWDTSPGDLLNKAGGCSTSWSPLTVRDPSGCCALNL